MKLFKKFMGGNIDAPVGISVIVKNKTVNEIIEEIHESFYTEVDKLLSEAKVSNSLDTDKQSLIDKCERLKLLGFAKTKEIIEAEKEINRLRLLKSENDTKQKLIDAINYFSTKYPNYKFITEDSVKKICAKYNLIYGEINKYTGTVPDKNLKHIEDFKISLDDELCVEEEYCNGFHGSRILMNRQYKNGRDWTRDMKLKNQSGYHMRRMEMGLTMNSSYVSKKCPLEIAAPIKDFDIKESEIKNFKLSKIEIPDPVVLKPVIYNNQKYYLIVTAWGLEASDELVVNQKMN